MGFTSVITHAGCWENTRKACKSWAEGEWFTSFSRVLPTSKVGYHAGKTNGKCGLFYPIRTRVLSSLFYKFYHTSCVKKTYWCDLIPEHAPTRVSTGVEIGILHSFRPLSFSCPRPRVLRLFGVAPLTKKPEDWIRAWLISGISRWSKQFGV